MTPHQDIVRKGYEAIAENYHAGRVAQTKVNIAWLDSLRPMLPISGHILDLGCGGGCPISKYFADRGYSVTGVDVSEAMIAIARVNIPDATLIIGDIASCDFDPQSFDLIVSFFAIFHLPRDSHFDMFQRMHRWLSTDGRIFISLGGTNEAAKTVENWGGAPMFWSHYDSAVNKQLLERAGFSIDWSLEEDRGADGKHLYVIAHKNALQ